MASLPLSQQTSPVTATVGGLPGAVLYAGSAFGRIGVMQINLQIPSDAVADSTAPIAIGNLL